MFTGPGRPDSIVVVACRSACGSMSTRVGCQLRFTTGRTMLTKSAWKCRLISWNGLRLNCEVGTLAEIASTAEESVSAQASGMMMLQEPGPQEVSVATGLCFSWFLVSAMCTVTCSCRGETSVILSRDS